MARAFVNWSETVRSEPTSWARPSSEDEVAEVVRQARTRGGRVKVVGSGHSWSSAAAGDDVQLSIAELDRFVAVDPDARTVTAEAGMTVQALLDGLAGHGLTLPIVGSVAAQTLAGVIGTGTHGSSLRHGNLGTLVQGARLIDGAGEVVELGPDDERLAGVRVHLGALGILTQLTLSVVPSFRLEERRIRMPLAEAASRIGEIAAAHEYVKLWWLPPSADAVISLYDRTSTPGDRSERAHRTDAWINRRLFPSVLGFGGRHPSWIPTINGAIDRLHFRPSVRRGRSDHMLTLVMPPKHRETEMAFGVEHAGDALRALPDILKAHDTTLDFIQELRFVKGDDAWMSPAYGRDTCQFGVYATHAPRIDEVFAAWREQTAAWDARPHWGKELALDPDEVTARYPDAHRFRALAASFDPDGVFRNDFVDRVLG